jgi:hypothetical protein
MYPLRHAHHQYCMSRYDDDDIHTMKKWSALSPRILTGAEHIPRNHLRISACGRPNELQLPGSVHARGRICGGKLPPTHTHTRTLPHTQDRPFNPDWDASSTKKWLVYCAFDESIVDCLDGVDGWYERRFPAANVN